MVTKLKFKDHMPPRLEKHLLNNYGFEYFSRKYNDFTIFKRQKAKKPLVPVVFSNEITLNDQIDLGRRCQKIKESFYDVKTSAAMIRFRIGEMARPLNAAQKLWINDWIDRNVDEI